MRMNTTATLSFFICNYFIFEDTILLIIREKYFCYVLERKHLFVTPFEV